jgi:hypothetical protein
LNQVPDNAKSSALRRWLPRVLRAAIGLGVAIGVSWRLWSERERLATVSHDFEMFWLMLAGLAYLAGLSTCALYWWWAIRDQGTRPSVAATWAAYFAGHLGKYVPGKGLVLVIRAGLLRESNVSVATGAVSSAHETLLMMATGALVSALLLPFSRAPHGSYLFACSLVLLVVLGVVVLPPFVSRWSHWVTRPFSKHADVRPYRCRWPSVLTGVILIGCGWCLMGLSLAAVLASMGSWPVLVQRIGELRAMGLLTAAVALATVGGFLSFLPGGMGSREWILVEMLGPALGSEGMSVAAVAALVLRIVWIVAEVIGSALFWLLDRQCKKRRAMMGS